MARIFSGGPRNLINVPEIHHALRRRLQLKEPSPLQSVAPELQCVLVVGDISHDTDPAQVTPIPYSDGSQQSGSATLFPFFRISNPVGSTKIIRVKNMTLGSIGTPTSWAAEYGAAFGGSGVRSKDRKQGTVLSVATVLVSQLGSGPAQMCGPAAVTDENSIWLPFVPDLVLYPNSSIGVSALNSNLATDLVSWAVEWTEESLTL